jgi:hypothetical protein
MREYDDYDEENIRLYTPVLQRVIILAAVIIAVPVVMWTITAFVRSYVAQPKPPALEHVASTNMTARIPTIELSPANPAPPPADQSAPRRVDGASASDATSPAAETKKEPSGLAALLDPSAPPAASGPPRASLQAMRATATGDTSTTGSSGATPAVSVPRLPLAPRSNDNAAATGTPSSSDRSIAWPNPNTTNPPDFGAPRLSPPPAPARAAAAEVLPAEEPIRGPIPLPRQRPSVVAMATTASGPVPLPRARPVDAPAETATSVNEPSYSYRPGLDSDR